MKEVAQHALVLGQSVLYPAGPPQVSRFGQISTHHSPTPCRLFPCPQLFDSLPSGAHHGVHAVLNHRDQSTIGASRPRESNGAQPREGKGGDCGRLWYSGRRW